MQTLLFRHQDIFHNNHDFAYPLKICKTRHTGQLVPAKLHFVKNLSQIYKFLLKCFKSIVEIDSKIIKRKCHVDNDIVIQQHFFHNICKNISFGVQKNAVKLWFEFLVKQSFVGSEHLTIKIL